MQLKSSINRRLQRALLGVKLPSTKKYDSWVAEVKEIASELEGHDEYCPKNSAQTKTKIGHNVELSALRCFMSHDFIL